ncbi:MAG: hypothetical protein ACO1N0_15465 [Fluviicola sp.]
MKHLFLLSFLYPLFLFGQNSQADKYWELRSRYNDEKKYDSVILVSRTLLKLDRKGAKEEHLDCDIACAAFKVKNYQVALRESKKIIPRIYIKSHFNRESFERNMRYQRLCFELADYYHQTENYKKEFRNISLINRKFDFLRCGVGKEFWRRKLYDRMIDCSNKLGKTKRAERLQRKRDKIE